MNKKIRTKMITEIEIFEEHCGARCPHIYLSVNRRPICNIYKVPLKKGTINYSLFCRTEECLKSTENNNMFESLKKIEKNRNIKIFTEIAVKGEYHEYCGFCDYKLNVNSKLLPLCTIHGESLKSKNHNNPDYLRTKKCLEASNSNNNIFDVLEKE